MMPSEIGAREAIARLSSVADPECR